MSKKRKVSAASLKDKGSDAKQRKEEKQVVATQPNSLGRLPKNLLWNIWSYTCDHTCTCVPGVYSPYCILHDECSASGHLVTDQAYYLKFAFVNQHWRTCLQESPLELFHLKGSGNPPIKWICERVTFFTLCNHAAEKMYLRNFCNLQKLELEVDFLFHARHAIEASCPKLLRLRIYTSWCSTLAKDATAGGWDGELPRLPLLQSLVVHWGLGRDIHLQPFGELYPCLTRLFVRGDLLHLDLPSPIQLTYLNCTTRHFRHFSRSEEFASHGIKEIVVVR